MWGKRLRGTTWHTVLSDHPHACGENCRVGNVTLMRVRTIPTRVGKTSTSYSRSHALRGPSPRVWGKPHRLWPRRSCPTDHPHACGENDCAGPVHSDKSDHPHACGENARSLRHAVQPGRTIPTRVGKTHSSQRRKTPNLGPSPRVWGKHVNDPRLTISTRTIPTRVGKTGGRGVNRRRSSDHPHACGENEEAYESENPEIRTIPTRVGKTDGRQAEVDAIRTIPTRVGKTRYARPHACRIRGPSPRVWGKRQRSISSTRNSYGPSPRVWGKPLPMACAICGDADHPHACGEND